MPDPLIREIPLIRRYSRHNEAEDWRFRTYLKVKLDLPDKALDSVVQEMTDEVWQQIDCLSCGNCCKTLQIVVDHRDINRLSKRLNLSVREFTRRYVGVAEDGTKHFTRTPCAFLGEDNACSVYEDRPQACRDFPYLRDPGFRQRTITMIENCATCPIVFNVWQRLKQQFFRRR